MRTKNIQLYEKINKMIMGGMKQTEIVSKLNCSFTTIMSAKKWAESTASKRAVKNNYEYAINMLLENKFFPKTWKNAIRRYLDGAKK